MDISNKFIKLGKEKNGHKPDCNCVICKNMMNKAKRGGYEDDEKKMHEKRSGLIKKNGHRKDCKCIICKNMTHNKNKKNIKNQNYINSKLKTQKTKYKKNNHKINCNCPICKNMKNKGGSDNNTNNKIKENLTLANQEDYDNLNSIKNLTDTRSDEKGNLNPNIGGKKRKTKKRK